MMIEQQINSKVNSIYSSSFQNSKEKNISLKINVAIKRLFDIVVSFTGIIALLPIFIIVAILIRITSSGPVFFLQDRLGRGMKVFKIIKFRTMIMGAEKKGDGLFVYNESDKRITKIGGILRKTSIDELPQLINVIKGDMSIVGPRPPVTYFPYRVDEYDDVKKKRFLMRPGITGMAQVRTRATAPWDKRIEIDLDYINNFSILIDLKIIFETLKAVFLKKNIYPEMPKDLNNKQIQI